MILNKVPVLQFTSTFTILPQSMLNKWWYYIRDEVWFQNYTQKQL